MKINKVIKTLVASNIFLNAGWGLLAPIFAVFILKDIKGGSVEIAGFASMIYWFTKSFLQIPIGKYLDKNHGEKDDFWFMVIGLFISGLVPIGYLVSSLPWHIYALQVLYAIGMAMVIPSWSAIFTRHIDRGSEALEWSVESTSLGFSAGIAGGAGGLLSALIGFKIVFALVSAFTITASLLLFFAKDSVSPINKRIPRRFPFRLPF